MKRILLLAGTADLKSQTLDFATYIARLGKSKLEGVFLESDSIAAEPALKTLGGQMYVEEITTANTDTHVQDEVLHKNIALFEDRCTSRDTTCAHSKGYRSVDDIIDQTRYADLLITDPAVTANGDKAAPSKFVIELLEKAECPVLISPDNFAPIDEVIIAFDGSRSSMFAIKQFYYHLPELASATVRILHVADGNDVEYQNAKAALDKLLKAHDLKVEYTEVKGSARDELYKYLLEQRNMEGKLFVTGAFGRNHLSTLFRPHTADLVLKAVDVPVFIAHD